MKYVDELTAEQATRAVADGSIVEVAHDLRVLQRWHLALARFKGSRASLWAHYMVVDTIRNWYRRNAP